MDLLSKMIIFATEKHHGQTCKGGQPYILHPLKVMDNVSSIDAKVVAVAHDLLEDTDTAVIDLQKLGCSDEIINALLALTKLKDETRIEAALRAAGNRLACEVKLADVLHNMDTSRLTKITEKDLLRLKQYEDVLVLLRSAKTAKWNDFDI